MKSFVRWADSTFFWTDLNEEELKNDERLCLTFGWTKLAIKSYHDLTEEDVRSYHLLQNNVKSEIDWSTLTISESNQLSFEGIKFNKIILRILELENNFVDPSVLYSKFDSNELSKIPESKTVTLQKYISWKRLEDILQWDNTDFLEIKIINNWSFKSREMIFNHKKITEDNFEKAKFIYFMVNHFLLFLTTISWNLTNKKAFQITPENLKLESKDNWVLEVTITDIWANIKMLLKK